MKKLALSGEAIHQARMDFPHVVEKQTSILACFQKLQKTEDHEAAKLLAFELYLECPSISGLLFFVSLSLDDRQRLLKNLLASQAQAQMMQQLAFFFHHIHIHTAFSQTTPSFELPDDFQSCEFLVQELWHAFSSDVVLKNLKSFGPWLSQSKLIDLSVKRRAWATFADDIEHGQYGLSEIPSLWGDYLNGFVANVIGKEFRSLMTTVFRFAEVYNFETKIDATDYAHIGIIDHPEVYDIFRDLLSPLLLKLYLRLPWGEMIGKTSDYGSEHNVAVFSPQIFDAAKNPIITSRDTKIRFFSWSDLEPLLLKHPHFASIYAPHLFENGNLARKQFIDFQYWQAQYQNQVLNKSTQIKFIGMPQTSRKPIVDVGELYVPQSFKNNGQKILFKDFASALSEGDIKRVKGVILGGPGMGKSTLFLYLHALISDTFPDRISILMTFRDFVSQLAQNPELTLMSYCYNYCQHVYGLDIPSGFFEYYLIMGRCLVLLDGMDEVGRAKQRNVMQAFIQQFIDQYPQTDYLISSRIAGYQDAAFSENKFDHFELHRFERDEITVFVKNWYQAIERDECSGLQDAEALTQAILAKPKVLDLAGNPLLLTLMALIHRYEAILPQDRHVLYEKCSEMLLQSWNASKAKDQPTLAFEQIPANLQRKYMENLAYHMMQMVRQSEDGNAAIREADLIAFLLGQIGPDNAENKSLVEDWVSFIKIRGGIVTEIQPGLFAFMHLTFLEYLCACAVIRRQNSKKALATFIFNHSNQSSWRECLLLIILKLSTDEVFLSMLVTAKPNWSALIFFWKTLENKKTFMQLLTSALADDVHFSPKETETILQTKYEKI